MRTDLRVVGGRCSRGGYYYACFSDFFVIIITDMIKILNEERIVFAKDMEGTYEMIGYVNF